MREDNGEATVGGVVPAPLETTVGEGRFRLGPDTAIAAGPGTADVAGYLSEVLGDLPLREDGQITLALSPDPAVGDEGYQLDITTGGIALRAKTPAGLFHGVQTLRQLGTADEFGVRRIVDRPRFGYRGVMLDVARHFFPVADVKRVIDLAALLKLNHLHLHLTDDQGWRIAVSTWPRLTAYGAGTEVGDGPGGFYTQDDYREIVTYAQERFITVVPEVDLPGHTNAALASYPELTCDGEAPPRYTGIEVGFSSLCAGNEVTYRFLDDVFGELAKLTPGPYLHLGGDEAKTTDPHDYAAIVERAEDIVRAHGKTAIGWHEIADADLHPSTVVQFWGVSPDAPEVAAAAARGNRIVLSPANRVYLDMKYDPHTALGLSWAGYVPVPDAYDWDPGSLSVRCGRSRRTGRGSSAVDRDGADPGRRRVPRHAAAGRAGRARLGPGRPSRLVGPARPAGRPAAAVDVVGDQLLPGARGALARPALNPLRLQGVLSGT
jgi:hexosaminidase